MREIKFRAWDKVRKVMFQVKTMDLDCSGIYPQRIWDNEPLRFIDRKSVILMQYTGLKDKNGKEIYGGDILKADGIFEVVWHSGGLCCIRRLPYNPERDGIILDQIEWYLPHSIANMGYEKEIIGNIYENPELMEGEMKDIEGTKDSYNHLLNELKFVIKKFVHSHIPPEFVDEFVDNKIDKCLKDYGVDWKLDNEEEE